MSLFIFWVLMYLPKQIKKEGNLEFRILNRQVQNLNLGVVVMRT